MDELSTWTKEDFFIVIIIIVGLMGIAFISSGLYKHFQAERLKKLEIPLISK